MKFIRIGLLSLLLLAIHLHAGNWAYLLDAAGNKTPEDEAVMARMADWGFPCQTVALASVDVSALKSYDGVVLSQKLLTAQEIQNIQKGGVPVLLIHQAVAAVGKVYARPHEKTTLSSIGSFVVAEGYIPNKTLDVTSDSLHAADGLATGWVGEMNGGNYSYKVLGYDSTRLARAAFFTVKPTLMTEQGWCFVRRALNWLRKQPLVLALKVPAGKIAFVIESPKTDVPSLNAQEARILDSLKAMGINGFAYVSVDQAYFADFSEASWLLSAQPAISSAQAAALRSAGVSQLYLGEAGVAAKTLALARWVTGGTVRTNYGIMEGYLQNQTFMFHEGDSTQYFAGNSTGWSTILRNDDLSTQDLLISRVDGNVKSVALSLNPSGWNARGWNLFGRMVRWLTGAQVVETPVIAAGSVGMILSSVGAPNPALTADESIVRDSLKSWGETIQYVGSDQVDVFKYSDAKMIVTAGAWLDDVKEGAISATAGVPVLQLGSGSVFPTSAIGSGVPSKIIVWKDTLMVAGYAPKTSYLFNTGSTRYSAVNSGNWHRLLGIDAGTSSVLYVRKTGSSACLTLLPTSLNDRGWKLLRRTYDWLLGQMQVNTRAIASGEVGFLVDGLDSKNPQLDAEETIIRDSLIGMGLNAIAYVPSDQVTSTDYTRAKLLVTAKELLDKGTGYQWMGKGVPVLYLYNGVRALGTPAAIKGNCRGRHWPDSPVMAGYGDYTEFSFQTGGVFSMYSAGWDLGLDCGNWETKIVASSDDSLARGAFYTLQPSSWNKRGADVFKRAVRWALGGAAVEPREYKGAIVLVVEDLDDENPVLNGREKALVDSLAAWGYGEVECVGAHRVGVSHLEDANLVVSAGAYIDPTLASRLNQSGVPLLLLGYGFFGVEVILGSSSAHSMVVTDNSGFLSGYALNGQVEMGKGVQYYASSAITGWNAQGVSMAGNVILTRTNLAAPSVAIGQIADSLGEGGWGVVEEAVKWLVGQPPILAEIPDQIASGNADFQNLVLSDYIQDAAHQGQALSWSSTGASNLSVVISTEGVATVQKPSQGWVGVETIRFVAKDALGRIGSQSVRFESRSSGNNSSSSGTSSSSGISSSSVEASSSSQASSSSAGNESSSSGVVPALRDFSTASPGDTGEYRIYTPSGVEVLRGRALKENSLEGGNPGLRSGVYILRSSGGDKKPIRLR